MKQKLIRSRVKKPKSVKLTIFSAPKLSFAMTAIVAFGALSLIPFLASNAAAADSKGISSRHSLALCEAVFLPSDSVVKSDEVKKAKASTRKPSVLKADRVVDIESLASEFVAGMEVDFRDPLQIAAFELYRRTKFGDTQFQFRRNIWSRIANVQQKYPGIGKDIFPSAEVYYRDAIKQNVRHSLLIRHLSFTESAFASALGKDIDTTASLENSFDPRFHYFTLTDFRNRSSGKLTIVLGEGTNSETGISEKIAFIDRIENAEGDHLRYLLEGVRRSVATKGYRLVLPSDVGNSFGVSRSPMIRSFVENHVPVDQVNEFIDFKPHRLDLGFVYRFTRAFDRPKAKSIFPHSFPVTEWVLKVPSRPRKFDPSVIDMVDVPKSAVDLKLGSLQKQLDYLESMDALNAIPLPMDPHYESTVKNWIGNDKVPGVLRLRAFVSLWRFHSVVAKSYVQMHPNLANDLVGEIFKTGWGILGHNLEIYRALVEPLAFNSSENLTVYLNEPDSIEGRTIMHMAAVQGNGPLIEWGAMRGANFDLPDKQSRSPLYLAILKYHDQLVGRLLKLDAVHVSEFDLQLARATQQEQVFTAIKQKLTH